MTRIQTLAKYRMLLQQATRDGHRLEMVRALAYNDLFYFLVFVLHREDANNDFVYARCREVQARPEGYLDAWAREHYKSTIITFAHNIWKAWHNPERTIAIIGRTSKVALPFLRQIKTELENNSVLWKIAPEVFWEDPQRYAPKWSEKDGLIVRRKGNPKEPTFSAFGMIDSLPVGPHFTDLNYDDAFEAESCRNPDAIKLTYDRFRESLNLGTRGGNRRFLCTRWHYNDLAASCIKAGTFKPRIYPATVDGTETGTPYLLTREELAQKIRDYGPYIASCLCDGTKILMSDWSYKNVEHIKPGDTVVGIDLAVNGKARLRKTRVLATRARIALANRYSLETGAFVECTPDHKWWTGRRDAKRKYSVLGDGGHACMKGLVRISFADKCPDFAATAWLSGMIDGEGSVHENGQISITQSEEHNPGVTRKLRETMLRLGLDWREYYRPPRIGHKGSTIFTLLGGRLMRHKLLLWYRPAKAPAIVNTMFQTRIRCDKDKKLEKVTSIKPLGSRRVWSIQTETGNYIANGFASKNCQLFMAPQQDSLIRFKEEWLRYWRAKMYRKLNLYILCDPASSKKQDSDYTVFICIGLGADRNYYIVNWIRDRLSLVERSNVLFKWHQQYQPVGVGYEKYGKDSDIEHYEDRMERDNYRFDIQPLGGPLAKVERINRLIPIFHQHRIYLPASTPYIQYDETTVDLTRIFVEDEYKAHPFTAHDDMLDCLARVLDDEIGATFPQGNEIDPLGIGEPSQEKEYDPLRYGVETR